MNDWMITQSLGTEVISTGKQEKLNLKPKFIKGINSFAEKSICWV